MQPSPTLKPLLGVSPVLLDHHKGVCSSFFKTSSIRRPSLGGCEVPVSAGQLGAVGHSGPGRGSRPRPECHYPSPRRTPCRRRAGRWHTRGQSLALPLPAQARRPRAAGDSTASVKNLEGTKQPAASRSETTSAARVLPSPGFAPMFSVCLNVTQSQRPAWRRLEVTGQGRCLELRGCPCSPGLVPPDRDVLEDKGVAMTPSKA